MFLYFISAVEAFKDCCQQQCSEYIASSQTDMQAHTMQASHLHHADGDLIDGAGMQQNGTAATD